MTGIVVFLLLSSLQFRQAEAVEQGNATEVVDRPTLSAEISKAVTDCSYPNSASNRSYADVYNASHRLPAQTTASPSWRRNVHTERTASTARVGGGDRDEGGEVGRDPRPLGWDSFLRVRRRGDGRRGRGGRRRDERSTYDSRSIGLPACTVQCVFTRLDAVDDMGYVTEAGVLTLLDNYVINRADRLAKTKRVVGCFRKLGSASEDDHCAHARKMALCFALDMNRRPSQGTKATTTSRST